MGGFGVFDQTLNGELGVTVGIDPLLRGILRQQQALGNAIGGAGARERDVATFMGGAGELCGRLGDGSIRRRGEPAFR